ncbi:SNAPG1 protein [Gonium pectorale]|uniref:Gamma-soluble NSF attachment protein n=1 Tax=Gonium pectorale TaxID=33097 RepID=A0A150G129_GONPE|nr:SNAPG1 protein [Gonium pectorale]|eukprot:KXZ43559.1 SNAPG1 protein [Gonium pectorale]
MKVMNKDKKVEMEKEAKELLKKAKGLAGPSLLELRFKPDWEAAAPLLDRAALLYKQSGCLDKALDAYERAAYAQERLGSSWHAGKHYEVLAELCRTAPEPRLADSARYYKMAADSYMECGKPTTAGECLTRGARVLEEGCPEEASRLYFDALDVYESSEREAYSADAFRYAAAFLVKAGRWEDAVGVLMRFGAVSDKMGARHSQNKAYLGAVVVWLWAGDAARAWASFQDAMAVEAFAASEEAFAADALFEAYRENDPDAVARVVASKPLFKHLDHAVGRLAARLPNPASRLRRMARKLDKLMAAAAGDGEGEEWEEGGGEEGGGRARDELL